MVASVSEAQEIAKSDFARRLEEVAMGCEDVTCPARYAIWAQGLGGEYKPSAKTRSTAPIPKVEWYGTRAASRPETGGFLVQVR